MSSFDCKYKTVLKRSGTVDDFNYLKIVDVIVAAMREVYKKPSRKKAKEICKKVIEHLNSSDKETISVEDIQDFVEVALNEFKEFATAKKYIIYRHERAKDRNCSPTMLDAKHLIGDYISASDWRVNENSNAGYSFPSMVNHISSSVIASYTLNSVYTDNIAEAHINGDFHIHDLGLGIIPYCSGWSLKDLLLKGFVGCHGRASASPAKHFDTALLQVVNFLSTLQTEFSGAQALNDFDLLLAPYVRKDNLTYKQVKQVIQQMVFGLNVGSRLGQCIPEEDEILSVNKGWVSCDDVEVGDEIYVFDVETKKFKTDFVKHVTINSKHKVLHRYYNNSIGFEELVTDNHRVLYRAENGSYELSYSEDLFKNRKTVNIPVFGSDPIVDKLSLEGMNNAFSDYPCSVEEVPYNGRVWCVTTDTGTIVVRHKGRTFITGNCPFTNLSFDLSIPEDMADEPIIHAGDYVMNETYSDYQKEMDMINLAFMEVMYEGDASGAIFSFPIPTYNLTNSFDWESPVANMLFKMTAKYGIPYFQNFISSDLDPRSVRSMCCRLRLDLNEIQDRTGGLFGAGSNTGSIGVCTMNLPRIGYLSKTEEEYFSRLSSLMELAKDSLETKRDYIQQNYNRGLLPYTEKYLKTFDTYFSTIGLVGMNESLRNFMGKDLTTEEGIKFALKVMYFMRDKVVEFQKETGHLFNLEATPGEGCSYRLAKIDKKRYADIITAGTEDSPYYTNSIQLPVNFTDDVFTALDLQEELQRTFTGGTVFHTFIGEELTPTQTKKLVKAIASNYSIPYFSITPTFSICPEHGYIAGYHETCPHCK